MRSVVFTWLPCRGCRVSKPVATHALFGALIEDTLNRPLSLEDRSAALGALATLAEVLGMEEQARIAHDAVDVVRALDAAQLRLFDFHRTGGQTMTLADLKQRAVAVSKRNRVTFEGLLSDYEASEADGGPRYRDGSAYRPHHRLDCCRSLRAPRGSR